MIFSKDFDLFSAIQKVRLSEKTSEILGQVSEKMKLESLAGLSCMSLKTNQSYLITAGFLPKHSYEHKNFAVVSVNRHQLDFLPWALPLDPTEGKPPDPHCGRSFLSRNISGTVCEISCAPLLYSFTHLLCMTDS